MAEEEDHHPHTTEQVSEENTENEAVAKSGATGEQTSDTDGKEESADFIHDEFPGEDLYNVEGYDFGFSEEQYEFEYAEEGEEKRLRTRKLSKKGVTIDARHQVQFMSDQSVLGGDFQKSTVGFDDKPRFGEVRMYMFYKEGEEESDIIVFDEESEEEEAEEETEVEFVIERDPYYARYCEAYPSYNKIKTKNNFLQTKMVEYFLKRNMEHVTREDSNYQDNFAKYCKQLEVLYDLRMKNKELKQSLVAEVNSLRDMKSQLDTKLEEKKEYHYKHELDIGTGLIFAKTGKPISDKLVEQLVRNQKAKSTELNTLRLHYIKVNDKTAELELASEALDKIGERYTVMDYEQLKIERRNHTDKIEERDEELSRLRKQCDVAIQCLAHIREKLSRVEDEISQTTGQTDVVESDWAAIREKVNKKKRIRDNIRNMTQKIIENSGLLTKPKLLRDMEDTMIEKERLSALVQQMEAHIEKNRQKIENIKLHIQKERKKPIQEKIRKKSSFSQKFRETTTLFRAHPSLLMLRESICDDFLYGPVKTKRNTK